MPDCTRRLRRRACKGPRDVPAAGFASLAGSFVRGLSALLTTTLLGPLAGLPAAAQEAQQDAAGTTGGGRSASQRSGETASQQSGDNIDWSQFEEFIVTGSVTQAALDLGKADSVVAFSAEDLIAVGAASIEDIASFTPNLEIVTGGATTPTFFIRGVGLNDFNPNSSGSVAIYQDDVAINAPAIQLALLYDVEAVNVLRGPQGSGLGRNASGGAIKLYSRKPTGQLGGYLRADFGNFALQDYEGAVEAPLVDDLLSARLAFRLRKHDGTMRNRCGGAPPFDQRAVRTSGVGNTAVDTPWSICGEPVQVANPFGNPPRSGISDIPPGLPNDVNDTDVWAARATFLLQPSATTSFTFNVHGSRRNELTRLGQSIGTAQFFCKDGEICNTPLSTNPNSPFFVPPELRGTRARGLLGGPQGSLGATFTNAYVPREIRARYARLSPCTLAPGTACAGEGLEARVQSNRAKIKIAEDLARDLDSDPWAGDFNRAGRTINDNYGAFLKSDFELPFVPNEVRVKTTTAVDTYDRRVDIDLDFSPQTLFQIITDDRAWQIYQDVSFDGLIGDDNPISWEIGGWFLHERLDATVNNDFGETTASLLAVVFRDFSQRITSAGAYLDLSVDFWEDFTLDGGIRYNRERKDFDMFIRTAANEVRDFELGDTWDEPTGTIRLTYRFRHDTHVFWKYTHGWKAGNYNATASQFRDPTVADPEKIDSFEGGIRGSWLDDRLSLETSMFFYQYENYQLFTARQLQGGTPEFLVLNASDAEVYGAEVEARARPWEGAFYNLRFSWLESQFLDFVLVDQFLNEDGGPAESFVTFRETQNSGNPLLNSPRFKVTLTAQQSFDLGRSGSLTLRYDGTWSDTTYYDATRGRGVGDSRGDRFLPDGTIAQAPYWLHNLRATWRSQDGLFEVAGWVRNLENTSYKTFAFDASAFQKTSIYFVGDPRTYGVSLMVSY